MQRHAKQPVKYWFAQHYMACFSILYGLLVGLPFLAPLLMHLGLEAPGRVLYTIYSFLCHQLPERSFFLFGPRVSYTPAEIMASMGTTGQRAAADLMLWRQFTGTAAMGWKVAWSDRMVSLYTSVLFFAWLWWPLRRRIGSLHWLGFLLFLLPMVVDGATHMASDILGMYTGFRYTNAWLAHLTQNAFPPAFYVGDAIGSFNSWMRLITGTLFGLGVVWFIFPILERYFTAEQMYYQSRQQLKDRIQQSALLNGIVDRNIVE